jgi:hypothetical protein
MSNDKTYNGWTNYATWRINLEIFDDSYFLENDGYSWNDTYDLKNELCEYAEEIIENSAPEGLARDYALAFLQDVNWYELAEHLQQDYANLHADA